MLSKTQEKILNILKSERNKWVSGEKIAGELGVSRATISNGIKKLKKLNYKIESQTHSGHKLLELTNLTLPSEIRYELRTKKLGKQKIHYSSKINSTNSKAAELASQNAEHGTLVITETQSKGRGRKDRYWNSPSQKGLYFSLIIRPNYPIEHAPKTTLLTAVVLLKTLKEFANLDYQIKWPNDILINGKKISGILTEMNATMDKIQHIVIGIGLNVNTQKDDFDDLTEPIATSLNIETEKSYSRVQIIKRFLELFEIYTLEAEKDNFSSIIKIWKENTNIIGKKVKISSLKTERIGKVKDITNEGVLVIQNNNNEIFRIYSGDVTIIE